jgi:hypothetical protein
MEPEIGPRVGIEVTPAMLEAGIEASALFDLYDPAEWEITAIYRAMESARRNHLEKPPTNPLPLNGTKG